MSINDVKTLLLVNSYSVDHSFSILIHCATYWAHRGNRVLFICKTPLNYLPLQIGKVKQPPHPEDLKLIQFMYLPDSQELLQQLYSIHLRHVPVSVIIVKNLENYFENNEEFHDHEDHVSLICASLLYAISTCAKIISKPVFLVGDYFCKNPSIERSVVKNYFHNVWEFKAHKDEEGKSFFKLIRLSSVVRDDVVEVSFYENLEDSILNFDKIIKNVISIC